MQFIQNSLTENPE